MFGEKHWIIVYSSKKYINCKLSYLSARPYISNGIPLSSPPSLTSYSHQEQLDYHQPANLCMSLKCIYNKQFRMTKVQMTNSYLLPVLYQYPKIFGSYLLVFKNFHIEDDIFEKDITEHRIKMLPTYLYI